MPVSLAKLIHSSPRSNAERKPHHGEDVASAQVQRHVGSRLEQVSLAVLSDRREPAVGKGRPPPVSLAMMRHAPTHNARLARLHFIRSPAPLRWPVSRCSMPSPASPPMSGMQFDAGGRHTTPCRLGAQFHSVNGTLRADRTAPNDKTGPFRQGHLQQVGTAARGSDVVCGARSRAARGARRHAQPASGRSSV